jgi:hypothetical protein
MMLPDFDEHGLLPAGDYELTLKQLRTSMLVMGPGEIAPNWDAAWRARLVDNLEAIVRQLWAVGVHESQVSRDERNEYHGVTVERASRILDAMGVRLRSLFEQPILPSDPGDDQIAAGA